MKKLTTVLVVVLFLATLTIAEDADPKAKALGLIDKGRDALAAGRTVEAVEHLQAAIGVIQQMATAGLASFLPEPLAGWTAQEVDTASGTWGAGEGAFQWNQASRRYDRASDKTRAEIQISTSPQLIASQKAAAQIYENPEMLKMLNANPDMTIEAISGGGWVGFITVAKDKNAMAFAIHEKVLVHVSLNRGDLALVKQILGSMDRAKLAESL